MGKLAAEGKRARAALRRQMIYAVKSMAAVAKSMASVAKRDLSLAMKASVKKMNLFQKKAAAARKAIANTIKQNAKDIARRIKDAVAFDARTQNALREETAGKIKNVHNRLDIFSLRMKKIAKANRAAVAAQTKATLTAISNEQRRARIELGKFNSADAKRQASSLAFLKKQLKIATKQADDKFGKAYTAQVKQLRQDFAVGLLAVTAESKRVNTRITGQISVVTGEVQTLKSNQITVNNRVTRELKEIRRVSNVRYSSAKRARGRLKKLMDENKAAASAEVKALEKSLNVKLAKARARNARNRAQMASDLRRATKKLYGKLAAYQTLNRKNSASLSKSTGAAATASKNALRRAQTMFASKMSMLTNVIAANAKRAQRDTEKLTGVT